MLYNNVFAFSNSDFPISFRFQTTRPLGPITVPSFVYCRLDKYFWSFTNSIFSFPRKCICFILLMYFPAVFFGMGHLHGVPHQLHGDDPHCRHVAHFLSRHLEVPRKPVDLENWELSLKIKCSAIINSFPGSSWSSSPRRRPPSAQWNVVKLFSSLGLVRSTTHPHKFALVKFPRS